MDKDPFVKQALNWHELLFQCILSLPDRSFDIETTSKFAQDLLYRTIIPRMLEARYWMQDTGFGARDIDDNVFSGCGDVLSQIQREMAAYHLQKLPPEVLSDIYEQYLAGKLKKTKGIYYTPGYIVRFIVDHALGRYLWGTESGRNEGKPPAKSLEDIRNFRILDPACGSGSFLAYAFDVLADFYEFYLPEKAIDWLPIILNNHLHGIDTDSDAVNITSIVLKIKALDRLKCLNVEIDFPPLNKGGQGGSIKHDNFLLSFNEDKFSMILGNPPYGVKFNESEKKIIQSNYEIRKSPDSSCHFLEKAIKMLEDGGILGFIVPKSLSYVLSWRPIREFLLRECRITEIADAKKAFKYVRLEQIVLVAEKNINGNKTSSVSVLTPENSFVSHEIDASALTPNMFSIYLGRKGIKDIFDRIWQKSVPFAEIAEIWSGFSVHLFDEPNPENSEICLRGRDIQRYGIKPAKYVMLKDIESRDSSLLKRYFRHKIVMQDIVAHVMWPTPHIKLMAAIDNSKSWLNINTVTNIACSEYDLEYLCGILNSRLMSWYVHNFIYNRAMRTMHFRLGYGDHIPIHSMKLDTPQNQSIYKQLVYCVKQITEICYKTPRRKAEIAKLNGNIESLVWKLYGITDKDIELLKENAGFY